MSPSSGRGRQRSRLSVAAVLLGGTYWAGVLLSWAASESAYFESVPPYLSVVALAGVGFLVAIAVLVLAIQGHLRSSVYSHVWVWSAVAVTMGLACLAFWLLVVVALVFSHMD
jgi:hypothetical protein